MQKKTFLEIIIIIVLVIFPHLAGLPFFSYAIVGTAIIAAALRIRHRKWADIGFTKPAAAGKYLLVGLVTAIVWTIFMQLIYLPFIFHFFDVPEYTEYNFIKGNAQALILVIVAAWIVGGLYEELVFRGYMHTTIASLVPSGRSAVFIAAIITSLLFGMYHFQQSTYGIVSATLGGLCWSYLRVRYSNLWPAIFSHAIYDTIALTMIYFDVFG